MTSMISQPGIDASVARAIADGLKAVERRFDGHLSSVIAPVADLCRDVERYRGKMVRPTLVLASAMACAREATRTANAGDAPSYTADHITVGAVVEMIHVATLVHDDVLDEADMRRGAPTVNSRRGNESAVILGDYLLSRSFHLCSTLDSQATALRIGEVTGIVCEGELLQLHHRGDFDLPERTYFEIIERKTAALIGVSCELGALHAGAPTAVVRAFYDFGLLLGAAFQIQDDLLDLVGDEKEVGKSLGKDAEKGKLTLPLIHHLANLSPRERAATIDVLRAARPDDETRAKLAAAIDRTGSIAHARSVAAGKVEEARSRLLAVPPSPARAYLSALADAVLTRKF